MVNQRVFHPLAALMKTQGNRMKLNLLTARLPFAVAP